MTNYDYMVVACYFLFITSLGLIFSKFSKDSSDFFRGGGHMHWWLVGATAFMTQFSAWTFTGAASKAYTDGTLVMVLYLANSFGYFCTFLWSAARFRQTRAVTPMEAIRERFGKGNEQFFTWISLPIGIFYAGIWLNAISKFVSVVFGMNLVMTILIVGSVVLFVASLGGSWAVVASDFMQVMILMPISIVTAFLAVRAVGGGAFFTGASQFISRLPKNHLNWTAILRPQVVYLWIFAVMLKQFCTTNNLADSYRFLYAKDTRNAKRAGLLASMLFFAGHIIWFIPPMAAAILYPDLSELPALAPLGSKISDGAYVAIGLQTMPIGMIGLMVSAIFAATISSMDSGLNKSAGIFVRNFYKPVLRKSASEKEYLMVGKVVSAVFGIFVILAALFIENIKQFGLFDVMMLFSSLVAIPFGIPLIWGMIIKRTPRWTAWSTVLVGLAVSVFTLNFLNPEIVRKLLGIDSPFTVRETKEYLFFTSFFLNTGICSLWFLGTKYFSKYNKEEVTRQEDEFYKKMLTPVVTNPSDTKAIDKAQLKTLGRLCIPYGSFIVLLCFIPNGFIGRVCFVFAGGAILGIGSLLYWRSTKIRQD